MKENKKLKIFVIILFIVCVIGIILYVSKSSNHSSQTNQINNDSIKTIEIEVANRDSQIGIEYLPAIKIEDKSIIENFRKIINNLTIFNMEEYGAGDYFEGCPIVTIYTDNQKFMMTACDNFSENEDGSYNNVIAIWKNEDGSDKEYYRVKENAEAFINEIALKDF